MGTGVSVLSILQKGLQGWIRTASTRRIVRRGKKPLRGFFRCAARAIHPRPPRAPVSNGYRSFCFISFEKGDARVDSNSCGAVAEDSAKTAQWAVFSSAARAIHPRPPKNRNVSKYAAVLFCDTFSCYFCFAHLSEQLCKNAVLHNKPGGGQGEGTAIKGGIPGADAVLHKGQLRGGKLLAVQGFVGFKVKPLAQTQL